MDILATVHCKKKKKITLYTENEYFFVVVLSQYRDLDTTWTINNNNTIRTYCK